MQVFLLTEKDLREILNVERLYSYTTLRLFDWVVCEYLLNKFGVFESTVIIFEKPKGVIGVIVKDCVSDLIEKFYTCIVNDLKAKTISLLNYDLARENRKIVPASDWWWRFEFDYATDEEFLKLFTLFIENTVKHKRIDNETFKKLLTTEACKFIDLRAEIVEHPLYGIKMIELSKWLWEPHKGRSIVRRIPLDLTDEDLEIIETTINVDKNEK